MIYRLNSKYLFSRAELKTTENNTLYFDISMISIFRWNDHQNHQVSKLIQHKHRILESFFTMHSCSLDSLEFIKFSPLAHPNLGH